MATAIRLKIGEVQRQTGVAVGALRYYESLELIHSDRGNNGYRYYPHETVQQVQFIKKAQTLGFSLEAIREILNIHQQGDIPCERVQSLLQDKIEQLDYQIQQMMTFKSELEHYRARWATNQPRPQPSDICPLISTVPL